MMNDLKEEIAANSPHISDLMSVDVLQQEFAGNQFESSFVDLKTRYK